MLIKSDSFLFHRFYVCETKKLAEKMHKSTEATELRASSRKLITSFAFIVFNILTRLLNLILDFNLRLITEKVFVSKQIKNVRMRTVWITSRVEWGREK